MSFKLQLAGSQRRRASRARAPRARPEAVPRSLVPGPRPELGSRARAYNRRLRLGRRLRCAGGLGPWQQRETDLALVRKGRDEAFPVIPVLLSGAEPPLGFLSLLTWVDLQQGAADSDALGLLTVAARRGAPDPADMERIEQTIRTICPYRGLQAFREEDAAFFCGREAFTERLVAIVAKYPVVAVVGPSGSGKSSVVRAGLVPYLRQRSGSAVWEIITLTPGATPLARLVGALAPPQGELSLPQRLARINEDAELLRNGRLPLAQLIEAVLEEQPGTNRLLLIIDQWEELYTQTSDSADRQCFVEELLNAARRGTPVRVVLTVRGDFFGRVLENRALADNLQGAVVNLSAMNRDELARAIIEPSKRVGRGFEPGLTDRILDNVGNEPGNLPLLEFLLTELWQQCASGHLTHAAYEKIGGVSKALAHYADGVADRFAADQERLKRIFVQLVRPGEGTEDTRQIATREQLGETNWPLVNQLADARLVVTGSDDRDGTSVDTAEIVHEALIRHWRRLREWIDQDRQFRVWQNRLRQSLKEWRDNHNDEGALLRGARLLEAEERLRAHRDDLSAGEREYIEASAAHLAKESVAYHRARRAAVALLSLALVIMSSLFLWAIRERDTAQDQALVARIAQTNADQQAIAAEEAKKAAEQQAALAEKQRQVAERQTRIAESRRLAAESVRQASQKLDLALLLALEAHNYEPTVASLDSLLTTIHTAPMLLRFLHGHSNAISSIEFSPSAALRASGSADGTIRVWNTSLDSQSVPRLLVHGNPVTSVTISPDSSAIATSGIDGDIRFWDPNTDRPLGEPLRFYRPIIWIEGHEAYTNKIFALRYSPDGRLLAAGTGRHYVILWDVKNSKPYSDPLEGHSGDVRSLSFNRDGSLLASGSSDETIRIWQVASARQLGDPIKISNSALSFHTTADDLLIVGGSDGLVRSVKIQTSRHDTIWSSHVTDSAVTSVDVSPDGAIIASGHQDGSIFLIDATTGIIQNRLSGRQGGGVFSIAFSADGSILASGNENGTIEYWRTSSDGDNEDEMLKIPESAMNVALATHGETLAVLHDSGDVNLIDIFTAKSIGSILTRGMLATQRAWK